MGLPPDAARHCTYADYLGWPDDVRCELIDGQLVLMSQPTVTHQLIVFEPDLLVVCDMSKLSERGVRGAPDWVMEVVSPSNAAHDVLTKRGLHERAGVREFWLVHPVDRVLTVHTLGADGLYGRSHLQTLEGQTELAVARRSHRLGRAALAGAGG